MSRSTPGRRYRPHYKDSIHFCDRADWVAEKEGTITAEQPAVTYLSESLAGCSQCADCGETSIPCRCCLECGQVQERVLAKYERCGACVQERAA